MIPSSFWANEQRKAEGQEGCLVVQPFSDELAGSDSLERVTIDGQLEGGDDKDQMELDRLKPLFEAPEDENSPRDFDIAEIAREELRNMIITFNETKPSTFQRLGLQKGKSTKAKAIEVLEEAVRGDFNDLKASIDEMEEKWKSNHGPVYSAFKTLAGTLDAHISILQMFPSQNNYASVLCGGLTCLIKAAKTHTDVTDLISESVASISDKVATCSNLIMLIKTSRMRQKLAHIYARMLRFYQSVIEWYLSSKLGRALRSSNENLKQIFDGAVNDIEGQIAELYREASIGSTAMLAMINGKVSILEAELRRQRQNYQRVDPAAGHRMRNMLKATSMEDKLLKSAIESAKLNQVTVEAIKPQPTPNNDEKVADVGIKRTDTRSIIPNLSTFVNGEEGPALFSSGSIWLADDEVQLKLRGWMGEVSESQILWISSPPDSRAAMTASKAAALATVSAAWQAETPIISYFCQRPDPRTVSPGMTLEQQGLIGLVYSFINQLLQFHGPEDKISIDKNEVKALDGSTKSWRAALQVFRSMLVQTPAMTVCVIDGLNDLAWGNGRLWCGELLDVLLARQGQPDTVFSILITTSGQSQVLPQRIQVKDRHMTTRRAREVARIGKPINLTFGKNR